MKSWEVPFMIPSEQLTRAYKFHQISKAFSFAAFDIFLFFILIRILICLFLENDKALLDDGMANVELVPETDTRTSAQTFSDEIDQSNDANPVKASAFSRTLDVDDENSSNSEDASVNNQSNFDALGLPKELIEEERKMALETEKEFSKFSQARTNIDEAEKERRYKTLMTLLGKSNQYASYMSEKLLREKHNLEAAVEDNEEPTKVLQNATNKRKSSKSSAPPAKKMKLDSDAGEKFDTNTHYRNDSGLVVSKRQPRLLTGGVMRNYQLDGLEWLVTLYKNAVNGILADEMGLGKTIQVISLICHLREKNIYGPHLIIAPLSTLPNWIFEFANFAPNVPVVLFHGKEEKRLEIRDKFIKTLRSNKWEVPVVITSYEMPLREKKFLSLVKWCYTIVDEGHRLKNHNSLLSIELRNYRTESRLLLTGTPLQNNITELWSLLNYLIPDIFDNLPMFQMLFDFSDLGDTERHDALIQKEKQEQIISKMHQILEPFLLRRLKSDVNIHLPRKKEILVYAPLSPEQESLYKATLDRTILAESGHVEEVDTSTKRRCRQKQISYSEEWKINKDADYAPILHDLQKAHQRQPVVHDGIEYVYNIKLLHPLMMCRKIVNHPYLVKTPVYPGTRDIIIDEKMIAQSGKLLVLDALLPRLKADGHKVLLFSTFTLMLDMIEDYVVMRGYKYVRLDGNRKIEDRLESIKQFNSDPETFIFLISTRAGGLGINLTAADTVIIYNSDWNPQVDLQAQDRCHRIGQTRPVVVYRLVTAGTIDERIVNCATVKRRLEKLVVKKGKFKQQMRTKDEEITVDELHELLKSTDYKQVIHPNGLVLSDEQIEQLLDRSDLLDEPEEAASSKIASKTTATTTPAAKLPKVECENVS